MLKNQQKRLSLNPNILEGTVYARSCIPLLGLSQGYFIALIYGWVILAQSWGVFCEVDWGGLWVVRESVHEVGVFCLFFSAFWFEPRVDEASVYLPKPSCEFFYGIVSKTIFWSIFGLKIAFWKNSLSYQKRIRKSIFVTFSLRVYLKSSKPLDTTATQTFARFVSFSLWESDTCCFSMKAVNPLQL